MFHMSKKILFKLDGTQLDCFSKAHLGLSTDSLVSELNKSGYFAI